MTAAILVIIFACTIFWLVFFKLKLLRLTPGYGIVFAFFVLHLFLVFLIGLRFVTPNSANATVVQRTIQLIPRLPEPTLVTAVLVEDNVLVKKDQPLFQFDRRPYEYKFAQIEAQLAEAKQNVDVLRADVEVATQKALRTKVELDYQLYQKGLFDKLAQQQAVREEDVVQWATRVNGRSDPG
jgi:multidrug resistance efflux pump